MSGIDGQPSSSEHSTRWTGSPDTGARRNEETQLPICRSMSFAMRSRSSTEPNSTTIRPFL